MDYGFKGSNEKVNYLSDSNGLIKSPSKEKDDHKTRFKSLPDYLLPARANTESNLEPSKKMEPSKIKKSSSPTELWNKVSGKIKNLTKSIGKTSSDPNKNQKKNSINIENSNKDIETEALNHENWNTFNEIFQNKIVYDALKAYAKKRHCDEMFLFFDACKNFKDEFQNPNSTAEKSLEFLNEIYFKFIKNGAESELNIDDFTRKEMKNIFENTDKSDSSEQKSSVQYKNDFKIANEIYTKKGGLESVVYSIEKDNLFKGFIREFRNSFNKKNV